MLSQKGKFKRFGMFLDAMNTDALSARTPKKPPIQAVFFRQHPRTYAGSCGFFLTSSLQLREHYLARSLSWGPIFSALLPYLVAAKLVSVGTWLFIIQ